MKIKESVVRQAAKDAVAKAMRDAGFGGRVIERKGPYTLFKLNNGKYIVQRSGAQISEEMSSESAAQKKFDSESALYFGS